MPHKIEMVLKAYLSRCAPAERDALNRFLPEHVRAGLDKLPSFEPTTAQEMYAGPLNKVHWSWFLPTLKAYPPREQKLFLAALDPHSAEQLRSTLNIKTPPESVTEMGKTFLQGQLMRSLVEGHQQILPPEFLPASRLNVLIALGKKELIRLIHFLSLYDLSAELRQIVDTKTLKKIYGFLTKEQQAALKTISVQASDSHLIPKLGLDRGWDGTEESLSVLLHRRGLTRLGIALSGQDPDLIWTICHHLDIGRGGSLLKLCGKEPVYGLSDVAIEQVMESLQLTKIGRE